MAIEVICKGCSRKLRVADENAGKVARCPSCGETFTVPAGPGATSAPSMPFESGAFAPTTPMAPASPATPADRWFLKTEDGTTYGPTSKSELDSWVAEGRVTAASQLLREGEVAWQPARNLYPGQLLAPSASNPFAGSAAAPNPYRDAPNVSPNPYSPPAGTGSETYGRTGMVNGRYVQPHRGGAILTLGILGLCLCAFLGIAAVVMASQDLKLMNEGRMDASGKGMTIAGLVMGIISIGLFALGILINLAGGLN